MFNIKRQETSIHFANNPKQSIYAFSTTAHTAIAEATATAEAGTPSSALDQSVAVSSTTNSVLLSSLSSSSLSSTPLLASSSPSSSLPSSSSSLSVSSSSLTTTGVATTEKSGFKLSTGAIAGIAVGGACALIAIPLVVFLLIIRRRNTKKNRLSFVEKTEEEKKHFSQVYYPNQKVVTAITKTYATNSSSGSSLPIPLMNHNNIININPDNYNVDELMEDEMFWNLPPIGTFRVISTYTQTLDDELYIQPGDKVQIYMEYDDGWCLGINLTRGGSRGVFPQHCINMERPL